MPKSALRLPAIVLFAVFTLYSVVCVSLYHYLSSDFVLIDTLWFDAIDLLMQWVEICGIALMFAFLVVGVYRYGVAGAKPMYLLFGCALLYKYVAAIIAISVVYGTFDITYDYSGYIVSYLIESGCCLLLAWLSGKYITAHANTNRDLRNAAKALSTDAEENPALLPFSGFFDRQNPVQRTVMLTTGIYTAARLLAFIISDIAYSMMGAAFQPGDIPVMLIYWILQIFLPCFIGYLLTIFTANRMQKTA